MQIENGATLSPLDAEQMTPVGRAMERGAKKSAQYLLQIGKPTWTLIHMDFLIVWYAWIFKESILAIIYMNKWFKFCPRWYGWKRVKSGWLDIDQAVFLACLQTETRLRSIRKQGQFSVFLTRQTWKLNDLYRSERTPFFSYVPTRVDERWRSLTIAKRPESRRFDKNYQCRIHQTTRHVKFEPVQMLSKIDENLSSFDNIPLGFILEKTLSLREQLQVFMFQLSKGKARIWPSGPCSRILSWFP